MCSVCYYITISHLIHIQFSIEHAKHLFMFPMGPCIAKNESFAKIPPKHKKTEDFLWELSNKRLDVVGVVRGRAHGLSFRVQQLEGVRSDTALHFLFTSDRVCAAAASLASVSSLGAVVSQILPVPLFYLCRNTVKYNNNNINNNLISITEDSLTHYDANHRVISQTQVTKVINKSVKFLDEELQTDSIMNANLTASQPLMNGGHSTSTGLEAMNMATSTEHDLNSGQQPHVTISSQHLTAREDRAFRTKIDK